MLFTFFIGGEAPNKPKDLIPIDADKLRGPESLPIKHLLLDKIAKFVSIGLQEITTFFLFLHSSFIFFAKFISFLAPIKKIVFFLFFFVKKLI